MQMTLRQWLVAFDNGEFNNPDTKTQCEAGWYDWFCRDTSLRNKTYKLAPKVKQIAKSSKVNLDTMYVFFKNNCPVYGSLYDDFRICDITTGDVIYTITPRCGHDVSKGIAEVYGKKNNFEMPLASGTWRNIKNFFGV